MEQKTEKVKNYTETTIYTNDKYKEEEYLQNKIQEGRERLKKDQLSTTIIEEVVEQKYNNGHVGYSIKGYCIVNETWEYRSNASFLINDDEAEYIKEKKAEIYMYPTGEYAVGTEFDLII